MSLPALRAADVTVFAAASLTDSLKEIAAAYEKASGDHIIFNFGSSGTLATQIKAGAAADIFISADELKMEDVRKAGLVAGSRVDLLGNSLAIVVPADSTLTVASAADLAKPEFKKIALGETRSVPAGIYAKEYLTQIGIWDQVSPRVVGMENVRSALAAVESGNVDAGIVYKTDALIGKNVKIAYEIPSDKGPKIAYPMALLKDAKNPDGAKKFFLYLEEPDSLKVFQKFGFLTRG
jgi:molybdate transport system substrate-binding protein